VTAAARSGGPGIYVRYAPIGPLLAYELFGPSRILVLGPDSALAPVILAVVLPLSAGDPMRAVVLASLMAVVSGLVCILIRVMRLGFGHEGFEHGRGVGGAGPRSTDAVLHGHQDLSRRRIVARGKRQDDACGRNG